MVTTMSSRSFIRRSLIAILSSGLTLSALTGCDAPPTTNDGARQITVIGTAPVQGNPRNLLASAITSTTATDITTAITQVSERQQIIINALVEAGLNRQDITTRQATIRSFSPPNDPNVISAYQASSLLQVRVEYDSGAQVATLISRTGGESTQLIDISYDINENSPLVSQARERAYNDAHAHAEQYAQLAGAQLGNIISMEESTTGLNEFPAIESPSSPIDIRTTINQLTAPQSAPNTDRKHPIPEVSVTTVWSLR